MKTTLITRRTKLGEQQPKKLRSYSENKHLKTSLLKCRTSLKNLTKTVKLFQKHMGSFKHRHYFMITS